MRLDSIGLGRAVVGDEWAPGIVDVEHSTCGALQRHRDRIQYYSRHLAAPPNGVRDVNNSSVYLV
jgi:hypothetical protein